MDLTMLSKKISSYRTTSGKITSIPDELAYEILLAWESWTGPASGFYKALGADHRKMASVMGRAKKLKREGVFNDAQFKEINVIESPGSHVPAQSLSAGIVLKLDGKRVINFFLVDQLIEFLHKTGGKDEAA